MKKKKGVFNVWVSILLTVLALLGIVGTTILTLYLMGRFDREIIQPQDMSFACEIEGMGYFDEQTSQLYVASDFSLMLTSSTADVTERDVTLSLNGGKVANGFVSNGIIKVPQKVLLNRPFTVSLEKDSSDWIAGGFSTITATSENVMLSKQTLQVSVDVPVKDFSVSVRGQEGMDVVVGSEFSLDTNFSPASSKYVFSNISETKQSFYSSSSRYIRYDWQTGKFFANAQSGADVDTVTVYTFANSYFQKQVMDKFQNVTDQEDLTDKVLSYLAGIAQGSQTYLAKTVKIHVTPVDVEAFAISSNNATYEGTVDKYFTLTASSLSDGDATLGATIENSKGNEVDSLFGNIGIKADSDLLIVGNNSKIIKVETKKQEEQVVSRKISRVDYSEYENFNSEDLQEGTTVDFYILPNTRPIEYGNYYWQITTKNAIAEGEAKNLAINLFYEDRNGEYVNFLEFGEKPVGQESELEFEKHIKFFANIHEDEAPEWKTTDNIQMEISYDDENNIISDHVILSDMIKALPEENVYRTLRYFVYAYKTNSGVYDQTFDPDTLNLQNYFPTLKSNTGVEYSTTFNGSNINIMGVPTPENNNYKLFEIEGSTLSAKSKLPNGVHIIVLVATVKTDADNKVEYNNGKYQIIQTSNPNKIVTVESSLSFMNMNAEFSFNEQVKPDAENQFFIPSVNRDSRGEVVPMINFSMTYKTTPENAEEDRTKISESFKNGSLRVVATDKLSTLSGWNIYEKQYVVLSLSDEGQIDQDTVTFRGQIRIDESYFGTSGDLDTQVPIYLTLIYDNNIQDQENELFSKPVSNEQTNHFTIYYQMPAKLADLVAGYQEQKKDVYVDGDQSKLAQIEIVMDNNQVSFNWGNESVSNGTITDVLATLNDYLHFTLFDQHGNEINTDVDYGQYKIVFEEVSATDEEKLLVFDTTQTSISSFRSTGSVAKTTKLRVGVRDRNDNQVTVFEGGKEVALEQVFDFSITSVGVVKIEKENGDRVQTGSQDYVPNLKKDVKPDPEGNYQAGDYETGEVIIKKYVLPNETLDMTNLIKVYTGKTLETSAIYSEKLKVKFSDGFINSLSETRKKELAKILNIKKATYDSGSGKENPDADFETPNSMSDMEGKFVYQLQVQAPFNQETTLEFIVLDVGETVFNISLKLTFLPPYRRGEGGLEQKANEYKDYLVNGSSGTSLFADESYELDEIFPIISQSTGIDSVKWTAQAQIDQGGTILSIEDVEGTAYLKIGKVYTFTPVDFTIYYNNIDSTYAFNTGVVRLYLNPNIAVVETVVGLGRNPMFDLSVAESFEKTFEFWKATSYIQYLKGEKQLEKTTDGLDTTKFTFENGGESGEYINIVQKTDKSGFIYEFCGNELTLNLGQVCQQRYGIHYKETDSSSPIEISAVQIHVVKNSENGNVEQHEVILCVGKDVSNKEPVKIVLEIGYGKDEIDATTKIFKNSVQTVQYPKLENEEKVLKTFILLTSGQEVQIKEFTVDSAGGLLAKDNDTSVSAKGMWNEFLSVSDDNILKLSKTVVLAGATTKNLTLKLVVPAIVSAVGDAFVYYGEKSSTAKTPVFNKLENVDVDFGTLVFDKASLETSREIYQNMKAGNSYNILHEYKPSSEKFAKDVWGSDETGGYGFYFNSDATDPSLTAQTNVSASAYRLLANGEKQIVDGLAEVLAGSTREAKLKINHMPQSLTNTYILLTLTLTRGNYTLQYYYHIKVEADVTVPDAVVVYPFVDNPTKTQDPLFGEYLDSLSDAYQGEENDASKYVVDFDEAFSTQNSKEGRTGKRFVDPTLIGVGTLQGKYSIVSANVNGSDVTNFESNEYFTTSFAGSKLTVLVKDTTAKINITVQKSFNTESNGTEYSVVGCAELYQYTLRFGQDSIYAYTMQHGSETFNNESNSFVLDQTIKANSGVQTYTIDLRSKSSEMASVSSPVEDYKILVKGEVEDCVPEGIAFTDAGNKKMNLTFTPAETVEQDYHFTVAIYTNERIALKINFTITSAYDITRASEFNGGNVYDFVSSEGSPAIFSSITLGETKLTSEIVENLSIINADEEFETGVTYANLVDIDTDENHTIEFAHLDKDVTFKFSATIKDGAGSYTFEFEILVKKSIETKEITYSRTPEIFGGVTRILYVGTQNEILQYTDFIGSDLPTLPSEKSNYKFLQRENKVDKENDFLTYTPEVVGEETKGNETFRIAYKFNEKKLYEFNFTYNYTAVPNVSLEANTPAPNGKKIVEDGLAIDYVSTTANDGVYRTSGFKFDDSPVFAPKKDDEANTPKKRIEITDLTSGKIGVQSTPPKIWKIDVINTSLKNLSINVTNGENVKTIDAESSDWSVCDDLANINNLSLVFTLVDAENNTQGEVKFEVRVNKVLLIYVVRVVRGSVIEIKRNAPNYDEQEGEIVYAEDLAGYSSQHLFEENRILQFALKKSGVVYHVKLEKGNEWRHVEISSKVDNGLVNIDLGESFAFNKATTYSKYDASKQEFSDAFADEDIYTLTPRITSRVEATFVGNVPITVDGAMVQYKTAESSWLNSTEDALNLKDTDVDHKQSFTLGVKVDNNNPIQASETYDITLKVDFAVDGAIENENIIKSPVDIVAGSGNLSLLDYFNGKGITIKHSGSGEKYTSDSMKQAKGEFSMKIYGFSGLPVNKNEILEGDTEETKLAKIAGKIDTLLRSQGGGEGDNKFTYHTGLIPRATMTTINSEDETTEDNTYNYLTLQGRIDGSRNYDYYINAQGCNNDGNHVMVRLEYTINVGNAPISKYYNILFKIVPNSETDNSKTNIQFKAEHKADSGFINAETTYTFGGNQTVANNKDNPYTIRLNELEDTKELFNIYSKDNEGKAGGLETSTIKAMLYGRTENSAGTFKYTYTSNPVNDLGYNDYEYNPNASASSEWKEPSTPTANKEYTANTNYKTDKLTMKIEQFTIGTRNFFVEFENKFGYRGRFYFRVIADFNPTGTIDTTILEEGTELFVGAQYNTFESEKAESDENYVAYNPFTYGKISFTNSEEQANDIQVKLLKESTNSTDKNFNFYDPADKLQREVKVQLELTLSSDLTLYKDAEDSKPLTLKAGTVLKRSFTVGGHNTTGDGGEITPCGRGKKDDHGWVSGYNSAYQNEGDKEPWFSVKILDSTASTEDGENYYVPYWTYKETEKDKETEKYISFHSADQSLEEEFSLKKGNDCEIYTYFALGEEASSKTKISDGVGNTCAMFQDSTVRVYVEKGKGDTGTETLPKLIRMEYGQTSGNYSEGSFNSKEILTVNYDATNTNIDPFDNSSEDGKAFVTLQGISANAFDKNERVDLNSIDNLKSKVNTVQVGKIDFIYQGQWIGGWKKGDTQMTLREEGKKNWNGDELEKLYTGDFKFYDDSGSTPHTSEGQAYNAKESTCKFKVPTISGIVFGDQTELKNVTMNITLVEVGSDGNPTQNTAVVSISVSITREKAYVVKETNVLDGDSPKVYASTDTPPVGADKDNLPEIVYNDTLEVELDKNDNISFFISKEKVTNITGEGADLRATTYMETKDATPNAKTTYYIKSGEGFNPCESLETFDTNTIYYEQVEIAPKILSFNNTNDYTYTEYVGISENLPDGILKDNLKGDKNNPDTGDKFYVYEVVNDLNHNHTSDATIKYNGAEISLGDASGVNHDAQTTVREGSGQISQYSNNSSALRLYLPSVNALNDNNQRTATLHFLYDMGRGTTYRERKVFTINPRYTEAKAENAQEDGSILVNNNSYYKMSNGDEKKDYYLIPFTSWAGNINLTNGLGKPESSITSRGINPEQLTFEVPNISAGGSAFVDEFGMLTTTQNFRITDQTISVKVYMKASGFNNMFEESNNKLLLGEFKIRLNPKSWTDSVSTSNTSETQQSYWQDTKLITIPGGYTLYGLSLEDRHKLPTNPEINITDTTFACEVNRPLDFHKILDEKVKDTVPFNKTYHLVNDGEKDIFSADNIDSWTFTSTGVKDITLVLTGRTSSSIYYVTLVKCTVVVYDNQSREERQFAIRQGEGFDLSELQEDATWYELINDNATAITAYTEKTDEQPVESKIYYVKKVSYVACTDEQPDSSKTYYLKNEDGSYRACTDEDFDMVEEGKKFKETEEYYVAYEDGSYRVCTDEDLETDEEGKKKFKEDVTYYEKTQSSQLSPFEKQGVFVRTFVAKAENGTEAVYRGTFFVYGGEEVSKSITMLPTDTFDFGKLFANNDTTTYEIYKEEQKEETQNTTITRVYSEYFGDKFGSGSTVNPNYYVVRNTLNGEGIVTTVEKYSITFKLLDNSTTNNVEWSAFAELKTGEPPYISAEDVQNAIKGALNLDGYTYSTNEPGTNQFKIEMADSVGELTTLGERLTVDSGNLTRKTFFVTYNNGVKRMRRVTVNFYTYEQALTLEMSIDESNPYELKNLDTEVLRIINTERVGDDQPPRISGSVAYYRIENGVRNRINNIRGDQNYEGDLQVVVGEHSFLFHLKLTLRTGV